MIKIYFDACCLNRPFDDQSQDRIRLETEAIQLILNHVEKGDMELIGSEILNMEIDKTPDLDRRLKLKRFTAFIKNTVMVRERDRERVLELEKLRFKSMDAYHIVCAESGRAEVFLTTDDKLLNTAVKNSDKLNIIVKNPLNWIEEVIK